VISLEGWTDVMYFVQDAHSFWNWLYFVLLIVVSGFRKWQLICPKKHYAISCMWRYTAIAAVSEWYIKPSEKKREIKRW
jgi:hypothetical protein